MKIRVINTFNRLFNNLFCCGRAKDDYTKYNMQFGVNISWRGIFQRDWFLKYSTICISDNRCQSLYVVYEWRCIIDLVKLYSMTQIGEYCHFFRED